MSKPHNEYIELRDDGSLVMQKAVKRSPIELHDLFSKKKGYKKLSNHLIELEIKGNIKKVGIFRLVPEGNNGELYRKRIQISKNDLDILPDEIISVYINGDLVIYMHSNSVDSVVDLPESVTTLFRLDVRFIKNALIKDVISTNLVSRRKKAKITVSRDFDKLFTNNAAEELDENYFIETSEFDNLILPLNSNDVIKEVTSINAQLTGRIAEEIVNKELNNKIGKIYSKMKQISKLSMIKWMNIDGESYNSYDFIIDKKYIEVKGSEGKGSFIYSRLENELRKENVNEYLLIKLNGIDINKKTYDDVKIYTGDQLEKMEMKIMNLLVKEGNDE